MHWIQVKKSFFTVVFELVYSITSDNATIHYLSALATLAEFIQVLAYAFDPAIPWQSLKIQQAFHYIILPWKNSQFYWTFVALFVAVSFGVCLLVQQVHRKGEISSFLVLRVLRILVGLNATIFFIPSLEHLMAPFVPLLDGSVMSDTIVFGHDPYSYSTSIQGAYTQWIISGICVPLQMMVVILLHIFWYEPTTLSFSYVSMRTDNLW